MPATVIRLSSGNFAENAVGFYPGLVAQRLIRPGVLDAAMGFSRTHSPGTASTTRTSALGVWSELSQNAPCFDGAAQRLRVRGGRTHPNVNTRLDGAVVGTPGTVPTGYASFGSTGLGTQIVAIGQEDGIDFMDVRFYGTITNAARHYFAGPHVPAVQGNSVTFASFLRLIAGSFAGVSSVAVGISEYSSVPGYLGDGGNDIRGLVTGAALRGQRFSYNRTMANASAATARPWIGVLAPVSTAVDFTLRIGWPTFAKANAVYIPALPPTNAPQDVTIGADRPIWTPEGGIPAAGTLALAFVAGQVAGATDQGLLQIDDGTDANRIVLRNVAGGNTCDARVVAAGVTVATLGLPAQVPGSLGRVALAWDATGLSVVGTGGVMQTYTGALPAGLVRALAGHAAANGSLAMDGEVESLHRYTTRLPSPSLLAVVA